jgi:hypothetical protein
MMRRLALITVLGACSQEPAVLACTPVGDARPICGLRNPEDLALLGDDRTVIVSQYDLAHGPAPGSLALLDLESHAVTVVYPSDAPARATWGDPHCKTPPGSVFSPHGIDLHTRPDGVLQLLVINHGGRESVELFEVARAEGGWAVSWRGCAEAPDDAFFNDVVGVPDGFLATSMMSRSHPTWDVLRAQLGGDTGMVYAWHPARGFHAVPGTEAPMPNGIEASATGDSFFVDIYADDELRQHDRKTGKLLGRTKVRSPDNLTWSRDGRLLVTSHPGGLLSTLPCLDLKEGACPMEFAVIAIDPKDWSHELVYQNKGAPMGGGTTTIDLGNALLIGSSAGDRVLHVARRGRSGS